MNDYKEKFEKNESCWKVSSPNFGYAKDMLTDNIKESSFQVFD